MLIENEEIESVLMKEESQLFREAVIKKPEMCITHCQLY